MSTEFCRHIHVTGRRCECPALRAKPYCYFHARSRTRHHVPVPETTEVILHPLRDHRIGEAALGQAAPMLAAPSPQAPLVLDFPPIEDRESIQLAASMIVSALGRNLLDSRRAAAMLYALQVATAVSRSNAPEDESYTVQTETLTTPDGADLAPDEDPSEPTSSPRV